MTDTLNWIYTQDHKPTFEECEGKVLVYHRTGWDVLAVSAINIWNKHSYSGVFYSDHTEDVAPADRYCILSITDPDPEPVPCKVCGGKVEYVHDPAYDGDKNPYVVECTRGGHVISFTAPTRAEAIQLWNKWNS